MRSGIVVPMVALIVVLLPGVAVANDALPYSWGDNAAGQVSSRADAVITTPLKASLPGEVSGQDVVGLDAGAWHTCAFTAQGEVFCWGDNSAGQIGNGGDEPMSNSFRVVGLGPSVDRRVVDVAAGSQHSCALTDAGRVWCWGRNFSGQVGDATTEPRFRPAEVTGDLIGLKVVQVAAGAAHTCALTDVGDLWCWGRNSEGQLGDGSTTPSARPVRVTGLPAGMSFTSVAAGEHFTCATTSEGAATCWGRNTDGQLGDGTRVARSSPSKVQTGQAPAVTKVAAGRTHACAILDDGGTRCWGRNDQGQLGDGSTTGSLVPVAVTGDVGGSRAVKLAVGTNHTCVETDQALAYCWGANGSGQLGDATTVGSSVPVVVRSKVSQKSETPVVGIAAGHNFSVGLLASSAAPGSPTAVVVDGTVLSWASPRLTGQAGTTLTRYQVSYRPADQPKGGIFGYVPGDVTSVDLAGTCPPYSVCTLGGGALMPGKKYIWTVAAVGASGIAGQASNGTPAEWPGPEVLRPAIAVETTPGMPAVVGLDGPMLNWNPPSFNGGAGAQTAQYSIRIRRAGETTFAEYASVPASATSYSLTGPCPIGGICPKKGGELQAGVGYELWVYAVGADGSQSRVPRGGQPYAFTWNG